jgi:hypothetical protein
MTSHPLTHHEIFTLVEPFTRRGRHVDLGASDRIERRLLFKPLDHADETKTPSSLRETLLLENPKPERYRLTRTLRHPGGLEADLVVEGPDPGVLLDRVESIDPRHQFREKSAYTIARSYRLEASTGEAVDAGSPTRLILTRGQAHVEGLTLMMKAQTGRGMPAELELHAEEGDTIEMPEDMLAVIGWDWRRLVRVKVGWKSTLRLRGKEPDRSRDAEVKLTRTVEHLAETLAESPARYHERLVSARWNVAFRRAIPLLIGLGLIFGMLGNPMNIPPVSIAAAKAALVEQYADPVLRRRASMLWGTRGVGKSSIVRQVADHFDVPLVDLRLTTIEPVDIRGAIYADDDLAKTVWFPPEFLPSPDQPNGILFLDELTAADQRLQISAYSLILDRRVGHYHLPDGWQVVAAGTPASTARSVTTWARRWPTACSISTSRPSSTPFWRMRWPWISRLRSWRISRCARTSSTTPNRSSRTTT